MIAPSAAKTGADIRLASIGEAMRAATQELERVDGLLEAGQARIAALAYDCASYRERHEAHESALAAERELRRIAESERDAVAAWAMLLVQEQTRFVQAEIGAAREALHRVQGSPVWRLKRWMERVLGREPRAEER